MEDQIAWGLVAEEATMNCADDQGLPPGFRFHPTDEELVSFYLASKVFNGGFCGVDIAEVDLNRCEPWELPEGARMGEREWYFFSMRDRKYPSGLRTNRATGAGYWKATGKDREVCSAATGGLVGMKKTLVFYKGRAPRGEKTKWVLHEYRLDGEYFTRRHSFKEEWVICRILHKVAAGDVHYKKGTGQTCSLLAPPSSSSPNPCSSLIPPLTIPNLAQLESLLQSSNLVLPPSNLYQESSYPLFPTSNQLPISLTSTAPLPVALHETQYSSQAAPPQQEETMSLLSGTCWIDYSLLHNPFLCDMGALVPAGGPAHPHDVIFAAAAAAAAAEYDSLVS